MAETWEKVRDDSLETWKVTGLGASVTTEALKIPHRGLGAALACTGTFGGTVTIQVSVDGENWVTLKDIAQNDITFTVAGYFEIATAAAFLRVSTGAGVSDVDVAIHFAN